MGSIKGKKTIHVQQVENVYTNENGEVVSSHSRNVSSFEKEPPFVKMYLDDIGRLQGLSLIHI